MSAWSSVHGVQAQGLQMKSLLKQKPFPVKNNFGRNRRHHHQPHHHHLPHERNRHHHDNTREVAKMIAAVVAV